MNITIVAFLDAYQEYFRGDYDGGHDAAFRIDYPETVEDASRIVAELLIDGDQPKHGSWEISVLIDGRIPSEEHENLLDKIRNPAEESFRAARERRLAEERRQREAAEAHRRAQEQDRQRKDEERERQELARLLKKYEAKP